MTLDEVREAVDHLERVGTKITYATVLTQLGGGSKRDIAVLLPQARPLDEAPVSEEPPPTPAEVLAQFRTAQAALSAQLIALRQSKDIASLDALASVQVKLAHVESRLPTLEAEAMAFEHSEQMDRVAQRNRPLWTVAARAKCEAREGIISACETLMQCLDTYKRAHAAQVRLIVHVPWSSIQRAAYTSLPSQIAQTLQVAISGSEDARQWLQRVRLFDDIGCNETMPDGSESL